MSLEQREVTITNKDFDGKDEIFVDFYKCPECKDDMVIEDSNYCQECGVKLKWDLNMKKE